VIIENNDEGVAVAEDLATKAVRSFRRAGPFSDDERLAQDGYLRSDQGIAIMYCVETDRADTYVPTISTVLCAAVLRHAPQAQALPTNTSVKFCRTVRGSHSADRWRADARKISFPWASRRRREPVGASGTIGTAFVAKSSADATPSSLFSIITRSTLS